MSEIDLSIVIPACNEQARLPPTLAAVTAWLDLQTLQAEVIVVDDGSQDLTAAVVRQAQSADGRIRLVQLQKNQGKGAALRAGVQQSQGRAVLFFDADLSYPLACVEVALKALETADLVIGARDLVEGAGHSTYPWIRRLATAGFQGVVDVSLGLGIRDTQCGFKAFRGNVARALFAVLTVNRFAFDVELLFVARRWQLSIARIPVRMTHVSGSSVRLLRDSARMLRDIARIRHRTARGGYPSRPDHV